ncbi:alpha-ketoacid dehydrogenase subunit beta [Haploplasma modicum]|jgi:pyruvate dehydrogenase E1 component beta subunit|uniref:alpha-ketoacid dehydrogenase subunit beta n=1 Tax=Haploplasma modicum TaxID=2150 RepID=UPI00214CB2BA|nr:alpha-ketoacid dehydrogenase subunit beta [Haploplasma modicum]MCR1809428.1 alpha-ketoacid dehydrogenase subunit beta [Haploplasma modicum]
MATLNLIQAINLAIDEQLGRNDKVVVYGEDVGVEGGVFRATQGLQKKYGKDRVFDAPIAESSIVGTAIGMAMNGMRPIVEIQFDGFVFPAYNQIVTQLARTRNRSRGNYTNPVVIRIPVGGGIKGLEHHSESLETYLGHIPGIKVVMPSTPYDAKGLLAAALESKDPVIFLEPKRIYRSGKQEVPEEHYTIEIGKAKVLKEGTDITVVGWGAQLREIQAAVKEVEAEGISVEVIDLRTINPIDTETIVESVKKTGRFLVVHEAMRTYGPGAELIAQVNEKAFLHLEAPATRLTGFDIVIPLARGEHHHMINKDQIVAEIKKIVAY